MNVTPRVIDISHHNEVASNGFQQVRNAGIWGVIHKATESTTYTDPTYGERRIAAKNAGLLWGAYHFVRGGSMSAQVEHFLRYAAPENDTLLALDWEDDDVDRDDAAEFLTLVEEETGQKPAIYSGHTCKEELGSQNDTFFGSHRLWLAQYSSEPVCQVSWDEPWLWQYSGDGTGPTPHGVPGITTGGMDHCDMNHYGYTRDQLVSEWAGAGIRPPIPMPSPGETIPMTEANVRAMQECLNLLATTRPDLVVDGDFGDLTFTAIWRALEVDER